MDTPDFPVNETRRVKVLKTFEILDTYPEEIFDNITKLASQICGSPIALISFIDETRQWIKSNIGLDLAEIPRDISFCGHAILTKDLFEVADALEDERFKDNPLVIGNPNIRFYASIPLITNEGLGLGALCVIDTKPRFLTDNQRESLQILGRQVVYQIEYRLKSLKLVNINQELSQKTMFHHALLQNNEEELSIAKTIDILIRTGEMAKVGGWELNLQTMLVSWTSEIFRIHEIESSTLPQLEQLISYYPPEARPAIISAIEECKSLGTPWDLELPLITAKGRRIWVRTQGNAVIENGQAVQLIGTFQDITVSKQNKIDLDLLNRALSKANDMFSHVTNAMPAMLAYWDSNLICKFTNKPYIAWFGKDPTEIIGTHLRDLLGEQLFMLNESFIRGALAGEKQTFERDITKANGTIGHTFTNYIPDININGEVDGFYVLVTDITSLKKAEAELRLASSFFQNTSEGILITDDSGVILSINPAFTAISGFASQHAIGQHVQILKSIIHDEDFYTNFWQSLQENGMWQGEIWSAHKNGEDYLALLTVNRVILSDESKTNYVGILVDITENKLQEQKRLADEISHKELLVSEVHHRIKNNLQGVVGLLRGSIIDHPELAMLINETVNQVYAISIIHGLQGKSAVSTVRLCELIAEIAANNKLIYRTPIQIDIPPNWIPCRISENEAVPTALVLNELISNAIKYGDSSIGVNITLSYNSTLSSLQIAITNQGKLPPEFNVLSTPVRGKGLQLISSLLPKKGTTLTWEQCGNFVHVKLELKPPNFILENGE